jgi:hypothetical protein
MSVRLIEGDCLEMMAGMESGSVDLVLADPPYGSTECTWDSVIPLGPLWAELRRVIRPRGAITLCCKQPFTSALIASNREMFRYCWYWEKSKGANFAQTGYRPPGRRRGGGSVLAGPGGLLQGSDHAVLPAEGEVGTVRASEVGGYVTRQQGDE